MHYTFSSRFFRFNKDLFFPSTIESYFIVDVFPVIEGDQLEGGEHRPEEVVETGVTVIGVSTHIRQADVTLGTRSRTFEQIHLHTWQLCSRNVAWFPQYSSHYWYFFVVQKKREKVDLSNSVVQKLFLLTCTKKIQQNSIGFHPQPRLYKWFI